VGGTTTIFVVEEVTVTTLEQLKDVYSKWIKDRRFEGVIVKDRNKPYSERGKSNGKWKVKNYLSLDLVVLGYTLPKTGAKDYPHLYAGAWNKNQEQLVMVADDIRSIKIPKTDREKLLKRLKKLVIKDKPALVAPDVVPRIWVKPEIIIEVTTNGLRVRDERFHHADNSKLYHKGIIDFRERNDKELEDANSLDEFRKLQFAPGHT
jgi:ATP-dependent DNA ligase